MYDKGVQTWFKTVCIYTQFKSTFRMPPTFHMCLLLFYGVSQCGKNDMVNVIIWPSIIFMRHLHPFMQHLIDSWPRSPPQLEPPIKWNLRPRLFKWHEMKIYFKWCSMKSCSGWKNHISENSMLASSSDSPYFLSFSCSVSSNEKVILACLCI